MAALVEGHSYQLSSQESTSADKSVVNVKLTDTALKAFEEYQKIQKVTGRRPSIQFKGHDGIIRVPVEKSSDNPEGFRTFEFSLAAIQGDPKGSFESIQHDVEQYMDQLECLGAMSHKLTIRATDDIYQTTKERMTLAEEESKKFCAKEIKPSGRYIGRKIKKIVKRSDIDVPRKASPSYSNSIGQTSLTNKPNSMSKGSSINSHSPSTGSSLGRMGHSSASYPQKNLVNGGAPPRAGPLGRSSPNPTVINRPYRCIPLPGFTPKDRVIHLLAIRPYKKPELVIRLQKDGIRDKDKNSLGPVLQQVGVLNPRDNSFTLAKHLFSEVKEDWPGYTETDKALLKRRLQQMETMVSAHSSPAPSPAHSNSSQGSSPSSSHKRPTSTTDDDMQPSKKARIAHQSKDSSHKNAHNSSVSRHKKSPSPSSPKVTSTTTPDSTIDYSKTVIDTAKAAKPLPGNPQHIEVDKAKEDKDIIKSSKEERKNKVKKEKEKSHHVNNDNVPQNHNTAKSPASSTSEIPEYILKYTPIQAHDQRQQYKLDFNNEYEGYRDLHKKVIKVTRKFKELESSLREKEEGSEDYENIKNEIVSQYQAVKADKTYIDQRKKCDYLHKKLAHIKKLILDYDRQQLASYS